MSETQAEAYKEIRKLAVKTNKQLKELKKNSNRDNPVDMDMIKTTKAMFFEECIEIFKKHKDN
jgi:hypothetical protein